MAFEFLIILESRILESILVFVENMNLLYVQEYQGFSFSFFFKCSLPSSFYFSNFSLSLLTFLCKTIKPHYHLSYSYDCFEAFLFSKKPKINQRTLISLGNRNRIESC